MYKNMGPVIAAIGSAITLILGGLILSTLYKPDQIQVRVILDRGAFEQEVSRETVEAGGFAVAYSGADFTIGVGSKSFTATQNTLVCIIPINQDVWYDGQTITEGQEICVSPYYRNGYMIFDD
jgi:hypothetical protein